MTRGVTQEVVPLLAKLASGNEFTTVRSEAALKNNPVTSITQSAVLVLAKRPTRGNENLGEVEKPLEVTQVITQALMYYTPTFDWIDMFIDTLFPYDISYNSIGSIRFQTDVALVDSGVDQRISRWDQPLMEYDVAYGVRTMEHLHGLQAFFRAMRGKLYAFKYFDPMDHSSTLAVKTEARAAPVTSPLDQAIGTGDASTYRFQLVKSYPTPDGVLAQVRPIYKPKQGTVMIAVDGVTKTNWSVDLMTGVVTFKPEFVVTGQALVMSKENTTQWRVTGAVGSFSQFKVNDKIVLTGWTSGLNNTSLADTVTVASVSADKSSILFNAPATSYGYAETSTTNAVVETHPAPKVGALITAGFNFFVPVRFDVDRLPTTLEEYGIGSASDVKLVEVRPEEE